MTNELDRAIEREVHETLGELRARVMRDVLIVSGVLAFAWYAWLGIVQPPQGAPDRGLLVLPIGLLGWICLSLYQRRIRWVSLIYSLGCLGLIAAGVWIHRAPAGLFLVVPLALAAVVAAGPVAGAATAILGTALTKWLLNSTALTPALPGQAMWVGLLAGLGVVLGWMLSRNFQLAVHWSLSSYSQARQHLQTARERRAEVLRLNQALGRTQERLELANASLLRAWRVAEEAERRQKQVTAFISHELRTPLNLVIGFSEMLVLSPETYALTSLPPKARRDLNAIYQSARQVAGLVDDVLDMASADHGDLALMREPSDLWQVVVEAAALVHDYVESKDLTLSLEQQGDLPTVLIDRLRIRQVILNLLVNAIRFTGEGGVTVRASVQGDQVRVAIIDTGAGIPPDRLERIFQAFETTESGDTLWGRGTGLGLPLSQRLVQRHGGEMGAESVPRRGSTFWFTVPTGAAVGESRSFESEPESRAPLPSRPSVVVIDPSETAVHRLQRWNEAFRFASARDWASACSLADEVRALAIVGDHEELEAAGCAGSRAGTLPAIIGCPLPSTRIWARRLGVHAYLPKPVGSDYLLAELRRAHAGSGRVLVVDDDPRFLQLVVRILEAAPEAYEVLTAQDGRQALDLLAQATPHVLLLDLGLPVLSGREVLAAKAADPALAHIPVLVVSAPPAEDATAPLGTRLTFTQPAGLGIGEVTRLLGAALAALAG